MGMINAVVRLRRDYYYNYDSIKDSFIPAKGEVVFVDTRSDGLRAKVGDGISTYNQLSYIDADYRNPILHGYYYNGEFYADVTHSSKPAATQDKLYIEKASGKIYYYNGEQYVSIDDTLTKATAEKAGAVKLYDSTGEAVDGTITQRCITEELNERYKTSIDTNNELLIFTF